MAFRSEKTAGRVSRLAPLADAHGSVLSRACTEPRPSGSGHGRRLIVLVALVPALASAVEFEVRHDHIRKGCAGTLTIDERGVAYHQAAAKRHPHDWSWDYSNIQQFELSAKRIRVLTYSDNRWKLGVDREYTFTALDGSDFSSAYALLKDRLDQRFVAELADADVRPIWEISVKHLGRISGSEGLLIVGETRIVYQTGRKGDARTWRYGDIDNIGTSGPFNLTLTTFERARSHYGSRKDFNFQLKEPLDERKYNELWRRLNLRSNQ